MATEIKGFAEHFSGFKRHLKLAAATFTAIMLFGIGFAMSLPDVYKSSAFILIEQPDIPEEIVRSTVTTYTARQLTTLNEKILTVSNLVRIIEKYDLYQARRQATPVELIAFDMRTKIGVDIQSRESTSSAGLPTQAVVGFQVSFEDEVPEVTKLVADELAGLYIEENLKARAAQTSETYDFLADEVTRLEGEIEVLESDLARFKVDNADRLPSLSGSNLQMMNRVDQDLLNIERSRASLDESRIAIEAQLATVEKTSPVRLADGSVALSPQDQLKSLQTQLSLYESKYSEDHPDVIAARRDIASLKARFGIDVDLIAMDEEIANTRKELALAEEKYSSDHPDVVQLEKKLANLQTERVDAEQRQMDADIVPDNPAYIGLQSSLDKLNAEEVALNLQEAELRARMADYEQRLMQTPRIEKELASLNRTLTSTSSRYWVLRDKQFAAKMGEALETQSKGEEMILLEPPRVPLRPFKPNRGAIIVLTFLFALVAGVGVTQLADALDKSIRDSAGIISVQGVSPLVEIPYIYNDVEMAMSLKYRKVALASIPAVVISLILIVHFALQPLDVLFYSLVARLGL